MKKSIIVIIFCVCIFSCAANNSSRTNSKTNYKTKVILPYLPLYSLEFNPMIGVQLKNGEKVSVIDYKLGNGRFAGRSHSCGFWKIKLHWSSGHHGLVGYIDENALKVTDDMMLLKQKYIDKIKREKIAKEIKLKEEAKIESERRKAEEERRLALQKEENKKRMEQLAQEKIVLEEKRRKRNEELKKLEIQRENERREDLIKRFGKEMAEYIMENRVVLGMTKEMVYLCMGGWFSMVSRQIITREDVQIKYEIYSSHNRIFFHFENNVLVQVNQIN
ncbi:hypothetical protein JW960_05370 [candidate division KSB1 bacterium]|nr:hypothetical protein [candidate division KSB1 bacterium]